MRKARRIVGILLVLLLIAMLLHTGMATVGLLAAQGGGTSFPWWSALVMVPMVYSIPAVVLLAVYCILLFLTRRNASPPGGTK